MTPRVEFNGPDWAHEAARKVGSPFQNCRTQTGEVPFETPLAVSDRPPAWHEQWCSLLQNTAAEGYRRWLEFLRTANSIRRRDQSRRTSALGGIRGRAKVAWQSDILESRQLLTIQLISAVAPQLVSASANGDSNQVEMSSDGTKILFSSLASNLAAGEDTNSKYDVYLRDMTTGQVSLVSTSQSGQQSNGNSFPASISADGSKAVFVSHADNLVAGDTNGQSDIFIKDMVTGALTRVSTTGSGGQAMGASSQATLLAGGTKLLFVSTASNLVTGDTNGVADVFLKDLMTGHVIRVNVSPTGIQGNGSASQPTVSGDGTKVVFESRAANLVPGDTNGISDVFLKNLTTGGITRVSTNSAGAQLAGTFSDVSVSNDGTKIVFASDLKNLATGDTINGSCLFVKELATGLITRVSTTESGVQANGSSHKPSLNSDGTKVYFYSAARNLVPDDSNGTEDAFVKDLSTGAITLLSTNLSGGQGDGISFTPRFTQDGLRIAFVSYATNLVNDDSNAVLDVFVKNIGTGEIELASAASIPELGGNQGSSIGVVSSNGAMVAFESAATDLVDNDVNEAQDIFIQNVATGVVSRVNINASGVQEAFQSSGGPSLSGDGKLVAFHSSVGNLVPGDTNGLTDVFVKNLVTGTFTRVNVSATGTQAAGASSINAQISRDGTKVVFESEASNLVPGDTNNVADIFVKDLATGAITRVNTSATGVQANKAGQSASISADGKKIAFYSDASNLVAGDTNGLNDVFVKDLTTGVVTRVSGIPAASTTDGGSFRPSLSGDGTRVAFHHRSVIDDGNVITLVSEDVFVRNLVTGQTVLGSSDSSGNSGNGHSSNAQLNADGTVLVFSSRATNLVAGDTNGATDIFQKDLTTGQIVRVSVNALGSQINGSSSSPSISGDGSRIVFSSDSTNLHPNVRRPSANIFLASLNRNPLSMSLTSTTVSENAPSGTSIGVLSSTDADPGDSFTYSLVPGTGSTHNSSFTIVGNVLKTTAVFDFETQSSYLVRIRTTDNRGAFLEKAFVIKVTDQVDGTSGADAFVATFTNSAVTVTRSTNGGPAVAQGTFPLSSPLTIRSLQSNDSVKVVGTTGDDIFNVSSTGRQVNGTSIVLEGPASLTFAGAAGNDTYKFDADAMLGQVALEETVAGTDTIDLSATSLPVSLNLASNVAQVVNSRLSLILNSVSTFENAFGGSGNDTLRGNALANTLTGNGGNDAFNGYNGNDTLTGGSGNDTYFFSIANAAEADRVIELANEGIDNLNFAAIATSVTLNMSLIAVLTVHTNRTLALSSGSVLENAVGGTANDTLLGNSLNNVLTGNAGHDILLGNNGNDQLLGGVGNDILIGGLGLDSLDGGDGDDLLISGRTTSDLTLANLNALRTEWGSARSYAARIANIRAGVGAAVTSLKAGVNVLNDSSVDSLTGSAGTDWYFRAVDDAITDLLAGELVDLL